MKVRPKRILEHILFWSVHTLLLTLYGGFYDRDFLTSALYHLSNLPFTILLTYIFVYSILPLYFRRQYLPFAALSILAVVATILLKRLLLAWVTFSWLYMGKDYTFSFFSEYQMMGHFVQLAATVAIVAGLKYFRDWQRARDKVEALSAEKRAAELSFLKAQVHPHFLFNTLNSIYYEVLRKSEIAPDLIIRLSDMLRFTLYECKDAQIPIAKEIALIENYIALEQHRYGDRLQVDLKVTGATTQLIPPLILFSLVENAFKHGTSENIGTSHIIITLDIRPDRVHMQVENPIANPMQPDILGASKGIGMRNITQQLDLLFDNHYTLKTESRQDRYISTLEIPTHL
jgi:two-component system, LytTR family, sensor kinase